MNGKRAKALRRLNAALEQERLAFQEALRRGTPVPVKTMSMDEFNKARAKIADDGGIGVIAVTPRTPDVDPGKQAAEITADIRAGLGVMFGEDFIESRRAAKVSGETPSSEELDRLHESVNGPEAYAKLGSMGGKV